MTKTQDLFQKFGVKTVTMDDISGKLGISKKTLYKHFPNKRQLVSNIISNHIKREKLMITEITDKSENAIDEMIKIIESVYRHLNQVNPSTIYDLKKYYPESWETFDQFREDFIYSCIKKNLSRGMDEKLYRDDINIEIVAKIYINNTVNMINQDIFPVTKYNYSQLYLEYVNYHLRGIVSPKGLDYLLDHPINTGTSS